MCLYCWRFKAATVWFQKFELRQVCCRRWNKGISDRLSGIPCSWGSKCEASLFGYCFVILKLPILGYFDLITHFFGQFWCAVGGSSAERPLSLWCHCLRNQGIFFLLSCGYCIWCLHFSYYQLDRHGLEMLVWQNLSRGLLEVAKDNNLFVHVWLDTSLTKYLKGI